MNINSKLKLYICIGSAIFISITMFIFSLISPFELWDVSMQTVDYDKLLVLRIFWVLALIVNLILSLYSKPRKAFVFIFSILLILCVIKIIGLFII